MKKTKLLKPILASLIIESLFISSLSAAEQACQLDPKTEQLLTELNSLNSSSTSALNALVARQKTVKNLKTKASEELKKLKSIDEKEQQANINRKKEEIDLNNKEIDQYSKTSVQINEVQLTDKDLNIKTQIQVQPEDEDFAPVDMSGGKAFQAQDIIWHNASINTISKAAEIGQKGPLSDYFKIHGYNKLNYVLNNANDFSNFGRCLKDDDYQKTKDCDAFVPPANNIDPQKREQYFFEMENESSNYFQAFKITNKTKVQTDAATPSFNKLVDSQVVKPQAEEIVIPKNKHDNRFDAAADFTQVPPEKVKNTLNIPFLNKANKSNAENTTDNVNQFASFLIKENITNASSYTIVPTMPADLSDEDEKAYAYHMELGTLSNLELLFARPVDMNKDEMVQAFKHRMKDQINEDRRNASLYDDKCLQSMKNSRENPPRISKDNIKVCAELSQKFVNTLEDYDSRIAQDVKRLKQEMNKKFDDTFYAVEDLKLSVVKEAYASCKEKNNQFSTELSHSIYPCSQAAGNKIMQLTTISNLGESSITIARRISDSDLRNYTPKEEASKIRELCQTVMDRQSREIENVKKLENESQSFVSSYCRSKNFINKSASSESDKPRRIQQNALSQREKNYHMSMSTDGSNKIIYTPKQSFAEGFVRALVNNLATAAPGYMNYFQQGLMIDTMRSDGFIKKQALHNYKFYQNNLLAGQLPWTNSLTSFGYTVNSNLSYPINSTTTSTSLSGTGIGSGDFSF